ncbi:intraflagellar transport protein 20 [Aphelenchoides avenae]|nr:intraflagellar transport protein 20 [Aphelenchus avenae]
MDEVKRLPNSDVVIDDLNRIRIANPDVVESSNALKGESEHFVDTIDAFNSLVNNILPTLSEIGKIADAERLRAMAAENALKSSDGANSEENQQMQIIIRERQMELERLKVELRHVKQIEAQQNEFLQKLRSPI